MVCGVCVCVYQLIGVGEIRRSGSHTEVGAAELRKRVVQTWPRFRPFDDALLFRGLIGSRDRRCCYLEDKNRLFNISNRKCEGVMCKNTRTLMLE